MSLQIRPQLTAAYRQPVLQIQCLLGRLIPWKSKINNEMSNTALDYMSSATQASPSTANKNTMLQESIPAANTEIPRISYLTAAKTIPKLNFPKKEQAIVFHAEENLKLFDYVKAIGDIIGSKNITFASRISNNRICIYLISTELVNQLIQTHSIIQIGDTELNVRRLISPTKRIVISNVSPFIPHEVVEETVKALGMQLASPVSFLKAGIPGEEYSHILSFRRQVYIFTNTENFELQTSIVIPFQGNEYRIFLSSDKMECFICKQVGHIASNCPNPLEGNVMSPTSKATVQSSRAANSSSSAINNKINSNLAVTPSQKRCHSDTLTSTEPASPISEIPTTIPLNMPPPTTSSSKHIKSAKKKRKTTSPPEPVLSESTKTAVMDAYRIDPEKYIIPPERLIAFLENTHGCDNPYQEALKFTTDIKTLLSNMHTIYPTLKERSIKNRFTRITKKIKEQLKQEELETGSISSRLSQYSTDENDEDTSDSSKLSQTSLH